MPSTLTFFFYTDMQVPPQELTVQKINIQPGSTSLIYKVFLVFFINHYHQFYPTTSEL